MSQRTCNLQWIVRAVLVVAFGVGVWSVAMAQRDEDALEIGGMRHTRVDGRDIVVAILTNHASAYVVAQGELSLVDAGGIERARTPVTAPPIAPGESSVLAVPLDAPLFAGRYTATLQLEDIAQGLVSTSGPRPMLVEAANPVQTPVGQPTTPAAVAESEPRGFPSWILLLVGLLLTVAGLQYSRGTARGKMPTRPLRVPEVSMVRRVRVDTAPPKRPATIRPLIPPRSRGDH